MKKIILPMLLCILLDRIWKILCMFNLEFGESLSIIKNFFNITLVSNTGAAFSMFSSSTPLLIMISIVVIAGLFYYFSKEQHLDSFLKLLYGILLGGIIGNLIDRLFYGYVIDYLDFTIFNYQAPIFNFADMCIVISTFIIIIQTLKGEKNEIQSGE